MREHQENNDYYRRCNSCTSIIIYWLSGLWTFVCSGARRIKGRSYSRCTKRELEGTIDSGISTVLPPDIQIHREFRVVPDTMGTREKQTSTTSSRTTKTKPTYNRFVVSSKEGGIMAVQTLQSGYFISIPVDVNSKFLPIFSNITMNIEAEHPIDVYVVNTDELELLKTGQQFSSVFSALGITSLVQNVLARVPQGQFAYVVIWNHGYQSSAIYYVIS